MSEDYLIKADLRVNLPQFMKELQRSRGLTTGRLDARFSGFSYDLLGEYAEYDPQDTSITGPFTAVFNTYVREDLKFGQDKVYHTGRRRSGQQLGLETSQRRQFWLSRLTERRGRFDSGDAYESASANRSRKWIVRSGYAVLRHGISRWSILGLPEKLQKNIHLQYYDAGHMMYLRDEDLGQAQGKHRQLHRRRFEIASTATSIREHAEPHWSLWIVRGRSSSALVLERAQFGWRFL